MTLHPAAPNHWVELRLTMTLLGLPIDPDHDGTALAAVDEAFGMWGISEGDRASTLRRWSDEWRESGDPSSRLKTLVSRVLASSGRPHARSLASSYFRIHSDLRDRLALTFADATTLLGYTNIVGLMAENEAMSAAQIAEVLRARGVPRGAGTWAAVKRILSALGMSRRITIEQAKEQIENDLEGDETWFADTRREESIELIGDVAAKLGYPHRLEASLSALVPSSNQDTHWPYLAMLHFACTPLEWYDHAPAFTYEFSPRGHVIESLLSHYRALGVPGNPFLNNAKSVDRLDRFWADSKDRLRPAANGLVDILEGLEAMPYQSKRQLAAYLRWWCLRQIRLNSVPQMQLSTALFTPAVIGTILSRVTQAPTHTRGVIEQRLVDAVAAASHDTSWMARGLGDSVNAANLPRRKLGDCEFQRADTHSVDAYEAHSGQLTPAYIDNHKASFSRVLRERARVEWLSFSQPHEWAVTVTFVAHDLGGTAEEQFEVEGAAVRFVPMTYEQYFDGLDLPGFENHFVQHVLSPLNEARSPQTVRDALMGLLET